MPPEDIQGYLELKNKVSFLIAAGESEFSRYGFRDLVARRAVDIIQPDTCGAGGYTEMLKIIALASAWNIRCIPHVWGTAVGLAANLPLQAAMPHFPTSLNPEKSFDAVIELKVALEAFDQNNEIMVLNLIRLAVL